MELAVIRDASLPDVAGMSNDELLDELARSIEVTSKHLVRLAAVWNELEGRGADLSRLRSGLREWLPMIAAGKLAAEAVVQFAGQTLLLRAIAELPLARQRLLAKGEELVVVTLGPGGSANSEKVPAHRLTGADIALLFDKGHIRPPEEQVPLLYDRARRRQRTTPETIKVRVAPAEYKALSDAAKAKRVQIATLVLQALRAQGLVGA